MVIVRFLVWDGESIDAYGEEILDFWNDPAFDRRQIDICEYAYPEGVAHNAELIRQASHRLQKANFTTERIYCVGCMLTR